MKTRIILTIVIIGLMIIIIQMLPIYNKGYDRGYEEGFLDGIDEANIRYDCGDIDWLSPEITIREKDTDKFYWRRGINKPVKHNKFNYYPNYESPVKLDWSNVIEYDNNGEVIEDPIDWSDKIMIGKDEFGYIIYGYARFEGYKTMEELNNAIEEYNKLTEALSKD